MTDRKTVRRIAVVTGGAGGIGIAICRSLAQVNQHVLVVDLDESRARATTDQLISEGLSVSHAVCDVSNRDAVNTLRGKICKDLGTPSVLVNLAGVVRNAVLSKVTDEDFSLTMSSHVGSTLNMMRAFAPGMKELGYGRIVNTSSIAAQGSLAGISYGAAKGAIEAMSRSVAIELAPRGITVNCICPGIIDTGMFLTTPAEYQEHMLSRSPMKRVGTPAEVASCVRFLASEEASFVTGQTLFVCGGISVGSMN